ncbi:MAG: radical SAM/SPASM domain-containing protein [Polyangiaceae bacterium]
MALKPGWESPRLVAVETTNHCNAKCVFCPNNALARDKGPMADDLFDKIIEDCREFPLEAIEPFIQGDPFSDPKILPRLEQIRSRLPDTKLRLYTNGYGMSPKKIDAMLGLGIDHLYVSINTLDEKKYRDVMGIPLERTLRNMEHLTQPGTRERIANKITFRMTRLGDTTLQEQDDFLRYCKTKGVRSFIVGLFNYKGDINSALPVPSYGCEHVHRLDILASGRVTLCCMDQDGEHGWGDAKELSVLELFNHPRAREYRDFHASGRRRAIDPCGTCNNFWPGFRGLSPLQTLRTGAEYCAYVARYRPSGRRAPAGEASGDALVQLLTKHQAMAQAKTKEPAAEQSVPRA